MILVLAYDVRRSGGIERLTLQVVAGLRAEGFRVRLLEPRRLGDGVLGSFLGRAWFLLQLVWWLPHAEQILSMHALLLRPLRLWNGWPWRGQQRRLCWLHGIEVWGQALEGVIRDLADCQALAASSSFTANTVRQAWSEAPAIAVIHPCADLPMPVEPLPLQPNLRLLTVARMAADERYKGHDQILDALALLSERGRLDRGLRWRVVGAGDDQPRLQQRAEELGLAAWIDWLGRLKDDQLAEEYRRCSLVIMPSAFAVLADGRAQGEGFGITYLEAALAGRPSIAALVGGHADLIRSGETGWLIDRSARNLADLIERLMGDSTTVAQVGRNAREQALQSFSPGVQRARLGSWLAES